MQFLYVLLPMVLISVGSITGTPITSSLEEQSVPKSAERPSNCLEWQFMGHTKSGVYTIYPRVWYNVLPFEVYCDMKTDGGGWTVFQRRSNYEVQINFFRPWRDYKEGFGDLDKEFWLGNDYLYLLTNQDQVTLRIDLDATEDNTTFANYGLFQVGHASTNYKATVGEFEGENEKVPGDSFSFTNGIIFATYDRNDVNNCSQRFKGGWWYTNCHSSNLNGEYLNGFHDSYANGINWSTWTSYHFSLQRTEMKIRPKRP